MNRNDLVAYASHLIEKGLEENKTCFKTYATRAMAVTYATEFSEKAAAYFSMMNEKPLEPARFVVVELRNGRWAYALDFTELLKRPGATGGYMGIFPGILKI